MPRTCTICAHEQRTAIDKALITGSAPERTIAHQYGVSRDALHRHRAHVPDKIAKAHEARQVAQADSLLTSVVTLRERLEKALEGAEYARDVASLARELRETLRLLLDLEGRLRQGAMVNVGIGILSSPDWGRVATAVTEALRDEPVAQGKVAAALALLANGKVADGRL